MPNASQTKADGLYGEEGQKALRVRLHALPVDGKANEALVKWLSKELGIAQREITLVRGQTSRRKQLKIDRSVVAVARFIPNALRQQANSLRAEAHGLNRTNRL